MADTSLSSLIAPPFWPVHADIRRGGHAEYWLKGGRGSCKSSTVSIEIAKGLMADCEANAVIYRKVADTLRDSVYTQMVWALEKLGVASRWQNKLSPMELVYKPTGQRVVFRGADDPNKSKGLKLSRGYFKFLWFEELTEFDGMQDIRTIKASVIRGADAVTFYTYNPPESAANWVNGESIKPKEGRLTHHSDYRDVPAGWLGASFLAEAEALRITNERAYRHMYLGEVTGTGGQVFEVLELRALTDDEISRMGVFYDGLDFGYWPDPTHWVRVSYDASSQTLYVLDELRRYRTSDRDFAALLKAEKGLTHETEIIADSATEKAISDMREEGLRVTGARKGPGSVEMGVKWLRTRHRIVIDPARAPETAKEFQEYEHVKNRAGEYVDGYPDKNNHAIDAVRYALNRVWIRRDR